MKRVLFLSCCLLSATMLHAALFAADCPFKDLTQVERFAACGCGGGGGGGQNQEIPPDKK